MHLSSTILRCRATAETREPLSLEPLCKRRFSPQLCTCTALLSCLESTHAVSLSTGTLYSYRRSSLSLLSRRQSPQSPRCARPPHTADKARPPLHTTARCMHRTVTLSRSASTCCLLLHLLEGIAVAQLASRRRACVLLFMLFTCNKLARH